VNRIPEASGELENFGAPQNRRKTQPAMVQDVASWAWLVPMDLSTAKVSTMVADFRRVRRRLGLS